jgi:hypothetical protein
LKIFYEDDPLTGGDGNVYRGKKIGTSKVQDNIDFGGPRYDVVTKKRWLH